MLLDGQIDSTLLAPGNNNQLPNQTYDSAGQVTIDEHGNAYSYDAEGRILTGGSGSYLYDGDGYRVSKSAASTTTLYWPSPVVGVADESNSAGTSFGRQVFVAGVRVWSEDISGSGVFLFQDHLGSARVTGTAGGTTKDDIDYLPFGMLFANYGTASDNHYRFTGDESDDSESSTEYATFRNLNPSMGRFHRPDPYDGSYDFSDPQSLNRYTYVQDRPIIFVDPVGLTRTCNGTPADRDGGCKLPVSPDPGPGSICDLRWEICGGGGGAVGGGGGGGGGSGNAPSNPTPKQPPPQKQGNSWSHPLTPPTCHQWTLWAASDAGISYVSSGGGKYWNPFSAVFGGAAVIEGIVAANVCQ